MIAIDFQGGMHGNYLEFVCNRFLAGVSSNYVPFNDNGASHRKGYESDPVFHCGHFFQNGGVPSTTRKIISVRMTTQDLLPILAVSLLRAGDYGYDNQSLEINTFNKLNNKNYRWVLDNLLSSFFDNQIKQSYDAVKDPSWPEVRSPADFKKLPDRIKQECLNQHNLELFELTQHRPDCPRQILREFFKIGFKYPQQSGFYVQQQKMRYSETQKVYEFPFSSFYSTDLFIENLRQVTRFFGYSDLDVDGLEDLHRQFLDRQPYRDYKQKTDDIFYRIVDQITTDLTQLDLLQEAYLEARLEQHFQREILINHKQWFKNEKEVWAYVANNANCFENKL
jgi:hypothetical protein